MMITCAFWISRNEMCPLGEDLPNSVNQYFFPNAYRMMYAITRGLERAHGEDVLM